MTKWVKKMVVGTLVVGLQCGLGFTGVSAEPVYPDQQQMGDALKLEEQQRHDQAKIQRANESYDDWQWRVILDNARYLRTMQQIQIAIMNGVVPLHTPVDWGTAVLPSDQ